MKALLTFCVLALASFLAGEVAASTVCPTPAPSSSSSTCCIPSQVLFLVDTSKSIDINTLKLKVFEYVKKARCGFQDGRAQFGLITFDAKVEIRIPLASYTQSQWDAEVNTVKATSIYQSQNTLTMFTPMAEAFFLAKQVFDHSTVSETCSDFMNRVVIVLTDGAPAQNFDMTSSTNALPSGYTPFPTAWLAYDGNANAVPSPPPTRRAAYYTQNIVPQQADALKIAGVRIIMVALPSTILNTEDPDDTNAARIAYFSSGFNSDKTCGAIFTKYFNKNGNVKSTWCNARNGGTGPNFTNSQCFQYRCNNGGSGFCPHDQGASWHCLMVGSWDASLFPIASDPASILDIDETFDATSIFDATNGHTCPVDDCFSA